ncbi:hypothetical protein DUI87_20528 [Hirundo rustica rustica]|uniref:Reverse transcriptase/retrotransposon-derived protein RNase H-like domain-containing protein n=1 Tax=Hirundo rustica rustica TaxID=333673 RepID=A0A3M0JQM8_HIRRU|nr:hypothetical protein DUI87_20528 [Hirundo rustica rustica]
MHIPEYSRIVSPLYLVTRKKNDFHWGPEQQQAFAQIKQEIAHAVALGAVRTGPDVKNVLYSAAGNNGLSWSLWQKVPGETGGRPLGFWSRSYCGSEANYTPRQKAILAVYEGVRTSEVVGAETQLLLAPQLPVLGWMFSLPTIPPKPHGANGLPSLHREGPLGFAHRRDPIQGFSPKCVPKPGQQDTSKIQRKETFLKREISFLEHPIL